ncbi:hypothetical protein CRG98_013875 [Punica granatum]|uniref:PB1-like domain-containing protein n=1 Tax=Punica granatum TaxID=22663 RepID=A0A2I0KB32_PUNGR|nr:hypothetical protein CRG98_013875 [Punica granatum]
MDAESKAVALVLHHGGRFEGAGDDLRYVNGETDVCTVEVDYLSDMLHDKEQFARGSTEVEVELDDKGIPVRPAATTDLASVISSDEDEAYHSEELHDRCVSNDDKSEEDKPTYPQFDENAQFGEV